MPHVLGHTSAWSSDTAVHLRMLEEHQAQAAVDSSDTARIIFVMDDGFETQYSQGFAMLREYNYKGCIAVIPAAVETAGYMSYGELADLYLSGWDMLNHTYNHVTLAGLTAETQLKQMTDGRNWLESHGASAMEKT